MGYTRIRELVTVSDKPESIRLDLTESDEIPNEIYPMQQ
jgi:hypothetical protein